MERRGALIIVILAGLVIAFSGLTLALSSNASQEVRATVISGGKFSNNTNLHLYINSSRGIERATQKEILDFLFNHDFEIQERREYIPTQECSLRVDSGYFEIDGIIFPKNSKLSLYVPLKGSRPGRGSINARAGSNRFYLNFIISDVLRNTNEQLLISVDGNGRLNRNKIEKQLTIELNKTSRVISASDGNFSFSGSNSKVLRGCSFEENHFFLIIDRGQLEERRDIEEVRRILDNRPEFIFNFEGLRILYKDSWWLARIFPFVI